MTEIKNNNQEAFEESEQYYRTLVDNIPGAVYRCAYGEQWTMMYLSDVIIEISGYPASDFIGNKVRSFASIIHPDDCQRVKKVVTKSIRQKKPFELEYRIVCKKKMIRWVYEKGQGVYGEKGDLLYLDGAIFEITDRKRAQDALIASESKYRTLAESSLVGIFQMDNTGSCIYVNTQLSKITGFSKAQALGYGWLNGVHPDDRKRVEKKWKVTVESGREFKVEFRFNTPQGGVRWLVGQAAKLADSDEKVAGFIGTIVDITALKESSEELLNQAIALQRKDMTLQEVLEQIEIEKKKVKDDVAANVEEILKPILTKLKRKGSSLDKKHIDLLGKSLEQLTSSFGKKVSDKRWKLTPKEIEICSMVKNGLSSKEIAGLLNSAPRTVEIHRNNIRKKLGLSNQSINLTSYLQSF